MTTGALLDALLAPQVAGTTIIDVTVTFSPGVPVWPTHPPTEVAPLRRIAQGDRNNLSRLALSSHAGTHVDAPWHFVEDGAKLLEVPLARWVGPCAVIRIADEVRLVEPTHLEAAGVPPGAERLLVRTANSAIWAGWSGAEALPFREEYVGLSPAAAEWIVERGIKLVGTDYLSAGPFGEANRATHLALLGNDVLIVETLDLSAVEPGSYGLVCLPLKLAVGDGAPARVLLVRQP